MKANIEHKGKSGIYCIRNIVNQKVYVGKAKCIHKRIKNHITNLNRKIRKSENDHIINAWHKYGSSNFDYYVLEFVDLDLIAERELYWITKMNSLDRNKGYNLRLDSSTGLIVSEETRQKLSEHMTKRNSSEESRMKMSKQSTEFWKNNPDIKAQMIEKLSKSKQKYDFYQYDKQMNLIRKWDSVNEILSENPAYKWQQIYSVCNGHKPTIYGFIWRKELKI